MPKAVVYLVSVLAFHGLTDQLPRKIWMRLGRRTGLTCQSRHRSKIGLNVAIEELQEALRQRDANAGEIARASEDGGVATVIRPYFETLTANG